MNGGKPLPAPLGRLPPLRLPITIPHHPTRHSCSSECANAQPLVARLRNPASYSVAGCALAASTLLIAARPSLSSRSGVRAPLRSHSPRHAATRRAEWGSMSRKGARVFSARRVGTFKAADDTPTDGVRSPCGGKSYGLGLMAIGRLLVSHLFIKKERNYISLSSTWLLIPRWPATYCV